MTLVIGNLVVIQISWMLVFLQWDWMFLLGYVPYDAELYLGQISFSSPFSSCQITVSHLSAIWHTLIGTGTLTLTLTPSLLSKLDKVLACTTTPSGIHLYITLQNADLVPSNTQDHFFSQSIFVVLCYQNGPHGMPNISHHIFLNLTWCLVTPFHRRHLKNAKRMSKSMSNPWACKIKSGLLDHSSKNTPLCTAHPVSI